MTTGRILTGTLILLMFECSSQLTSCQEGSFGPLCQYKCRCGLGTCSQNGSCAASDRCQSSWFGPECQYADLAFNRSSNQVITDGDDDTCITSGTSLSVTLDNLYIFTWLRVHLSAAGYLEQVNVQLVNASSTLNCSNQRNSGLDTRTVDIYCDFDDLIQTVILTGSGVKYLCSLYVSGGRNIALGQPAVQSSTFSELVAGTNNSLVKYTASLAVDGNTDPDVSVEPTCARAEVNDSRPSWNVTLPRQHVVTRFLIYSTLASTAGLAGFALQGFADNGSLVFQHTFTPVSSRRTLTIVTARLLTDMSLVVIHHNSTGQSLALCEVEVYGACGAEMTDTGCTCSLNCMPMPSFTTPPCDNTTGLCLTQCLEGYQAPFCNTVCLPGTYGTDCAEECTNCQSADTFSPPSCDSETGTCKHGCLVGFTDPRCTSACPIGTFGAGCRSACSKYCHKFNVSDVGPCDSVTGVCLFGCDPAFTGPTCSEERVPLDDGLWVTLGLPLLAVAIIVLPILLSCLIVKAYRSTQQSPEQEALDLPSGLLVKRRSHDQALPGVSADDAEAGSSVDPKLKMDLDPKGEEAPVQDSIEVARDETPVQDSIEQPRVKQQQQLRQQQMLMQQQQMRGGNPQGQPGAVMGPGGQQGMQGAGMGQMAPQAGQNYMEDFNLPEII